MYVKHIPFSEPTFEEIKRPKNLLNLFTTGLKHNVLENNNHKMHYLRSSSSASRGI